jgi:hypothetical protein
MKHTISTILTAVVILSVLTGCGAAGKQASTIVENEEESGLIVRIVNQSAVNLYGIAVSYSANGETLGSKVCERIDKKAEQAVYEFSFGPDELPAAPVDTFLLEVFAAEKTGENFSACGSAVINSPHPGAAYSLALAGEAAATLTLFTAEQDVEILSD